MKNIDLQNLIGTFFIKKETLIYKELLSRTFKSLNNFKFIANCCLRNISQLINFQLFLIDLTRKNRFSANYFYLANLCLYVVQQVTGTVHFRSFLSSNVILNHNYIFNF